MSLWFSTFFFLFLFVILYILSSTLNRKPGKVPGRDFHETLRNMIYSLLLFFIQQNVTSVIDIMLSSLVAIEIDISSQDHFPDHKHDPDFFQDTRGDSWNRNIPRDSENHPPHLKEPLL